jgi:ankyrin repeat protein
MSLTYVCTFHLIFTLLFPLLTLPSPSPTDFGNTKEAIRTLEKGAQVDFFDARDGWQGLHYAARWGKAKLIQCLLNAGGDVNCKTLDKETPLFIACNTRADRKEVIALLISRGANANAVASSGETPKTVADDPDVILMLTDYNEFRRQKSLSPSPLQHGGSMGMKRLMP